jgi:hypothetical protein
MQLADDITGLQEALVEIQFPVRAIESRRPRKYYAAPMLC